MRCRRPTPACAASSSRRAPRKAGRRCMRELARIDPQTAARLAPNDGQRIQRALEVHRLSGRPLSAWHSRAGRPRAAADRPRARRSRLAARPHRRALRRRCSPPASSTRCGACARAATCTSTCRRCARRLSPGMGGARRRRARAAAPQARPLRHASSPSASSPGCAAMPQRTVVACDALDASAQATAIARRWHAEGRLG